MSHSVAFSEAMHHELDRMNAKHGTIYDVYDCPAWRRMMGEATTGDGLTATIARIGLLFCIDGIPAFTFKVYNNI